MEWKLFQQTKTLHIIQLLCGNNFFVNWWLRLVKYTFNSIQFQYCSQNCSQYCSQYCSHSSLIVEGSFEVCLLRYEEFKLFKTCLFNVSLSENPNVLLLQFYIYTSLTQTHHPSAKSTPSSWKSTV